MYAVNEGNQKINGENVQTFSRVIKEANASLIAEAGTNGYKGGNCRDAGGRTYLGLTCRYGDFHFENIMDDKDRIVGVRIACCGDAGLEAITKALEFMRKTIEDQRCKVNN